MLHISFNFFKLFSVRFSFYGKTCHAGKEEDIKELIKFVMANANQLDFVIANAGRTQKLIFIRNLHRE